MRLKPYHFIVAISFSLLLSCGGESPFKPKDAKISLVLQNSSGKIDSISVTDTVEKKVRVGLLAYLPTYITSVSVTIVKAVNDTDTSKIFLSPISWADTQWIEIVFHSTGTRTVTAVVSVQGEPDKVFTASVIIDGKPIFITVDPASAVVNENSPAVLWVKTNGTGPLTFQWYKDNGLVSGATKDSLIFSSAILDNAGRYTCVIKDPWGDSVTSVSALLTVRQSTIVNHKPQLSVTGTRSITSGQTCVLHLSAAGPDTGQKITYKIIKGPAGGVLSDTIYQWTTTSSDTGFDTVVFSATDNGTPPMSDTQKISINVSPQLVPQTQADFTPSALTGEYPLTVTFTNNSVDATSYFWDFGDGKTSTDKNPINTFTSPGTYSIKLLATGNSVDSMKKTVTAVRPAAPTNVVGDSGITWIKLTWTKPSGSVSDTVYYAEGDTVTETGATKIANAISPCVIKNLKVGQTYSIAVTSTTIKGGRSNFAFFRKMTGTPLGMKRISSKGKLFSMGERGIAEPITPVTFTKNFWLDSTEVTQKDYYTLLSNTFSSFSSTVPILLPTEGNNYPVYYVDWFDAVLYCNARSKRDGLDTVYRYSSITGTPGNSCILINLIYDSLKANGYHLPTEAQWEFACRGGQTTVYYWGNDTSISNQYAWYGPNGNTRPVAQKSPNAYGLYDMIGNAEEYANDYWAPSLPGPNGQIDPIGPLVAGQYTPIVCRGGNSYQSIWSCASRSWAPAAAPYDYVAGFRVCYTEKN